MDSIELNGRKVLLNIVNHDSGEEPESACVNRVISIKLGEKTYHQIATDPRELSAMVRRVATDAQLRSIPMPGMITVVVTSFARAFEIDWPATVSTLTKMEALGLTPA